MRQNYNQGKNVQNIFIFRPHANKTFNTMNFITLLVTIKDFLIILKIA